MGKEAKLGLALIAVLLGTFGLVLYKRIKEASPPAETVAADKADAKPAASEPEKPKLSSGPLKPTVVQSSPVGKTPQALASSSNVPTGDGAARYGDYSSRPSAVSDDRTTRDPFASANAANSRYSDRYAGTSRQNDGAGNPAISESSITTGDDASTASAVDAASQVDPISRYGSRGASGTLTPTGDASAALLPASATTETTPDRTDDRSQTSERTAAEANPVADYNPLRSASADQSAVSSSGRSSSPRSYDLYGDTSSSTDPAVDEKPTSSSRVRFGPATNGDRYASEPASTTIASEHALPSTITERNPSSRYGLSATTDVPASTFTTRTDSTRAGWSGAGSTVSSGSSTASSATAPPKSAASPVAPVMQSKPPRTVPAAAHRGDTYVVQPNDSFSTISEKLYGTSSYFKALQEHNKAKYPKPDRLRTGDVVATPSVETLLHNYASLCPRPNHLPPPGRSSSLASQRGGRVYVVEEGDTLFDIARFELGKATRWAEIYELNKDVIGEDFNHLRPGTQLALPAEVHDDTFTRRPGTSLPR